MCASSSLLLSSLELSDTHVYEPQIRALLGTAECVRELIEAGADLNALNDEGNTSLILSTICMADGSGDCAKVWTPS